MVPALRGLTQEGSWVRTGEVPGSWASPGYLLMLMAQLMCGIISMRHMQSLASRNSQGHSWENLRKIESHGHIHLILAPQSDLTSFFSR